MSGAALRDVADDEPEFDVCGQDEPPDVAQAAADRERCKRVPTNLSHAIGRPYDMRLSAYEREVSGDYWRVACADALLGLGDAEAIAEAFADHAKGAASLLEIDVGQAQGIAQAAWARHVSGAASSEHFMRSRASWSVRQADSRDAMENAAIEACAKVGAARAPLPWFALHFGRSNEARRTTWWNTMLENLAARPRAARTRRRGK